MQRLKNIYRRLNLLQDRMWFKIAATIIVALAISGTFGVLIAKSYSLHAQRNALTEALSGQNLRESDEYAVAIANRGTFELNGREYGSPQLAERADILFDANGNLMQPSALATLLLQDQIPAWAPRWLLDQPETTWMLAVVALLWLVLIVWLPATVPFILTLLGTALPAWLAAQAGYETAAWVVAGFGLLVFTFIALNRALMIALSRPRQALAVAHTVLKEASRARLPLVFIVLLLIILPLLPLWLDHEAPLRYQVQTFISRSFGFTYAVAAVLTLVLACSSVAFEIRDKQIWQLVSKPMSRFSYLLGKWIGIMSINLVILIVAGISIFVYIQYLRSRPSDTGLAGQLDRIELRDTVLTARAATRPTYIEIDPADLQQRVELEIQSDPELSREEEPPPGLRRAIAQRIRQAFLAGQRSIPPGAGRPYIFDGLGGAKDRGESLTLRYKFLMMNNEPSETYPAAFVFYENGDESQPRVVPRNFVPTISQILIVPSEYIGEDGTLRIAVVNTVQPTPDGVYAPLNFEESGLEVLAQVSSFEANFIRAIFVTWMKLAFLAGLGIFFAIFLSFPVALLASLTIFLGATLTPYLAMSLETFEPPSFAQARTSGEVGMYIQWAFQNSIEFIGETIVFTLRGFGQFRPAQDLVEGRLISWGTVGFAILTLGVLWQAAALGGGFLIMRRRELAVYSGQS